MRPLPHRRTSFQARPAGTAGTARPACSAETARPAYSAGTARPACSAETARPACSAERADSAGSAETERPAETADSAGTAGSGWTARSCRTVPTASTGQTGPRPQEQSWRAGRLPPKASIRLSGFFLGHAFFLRLKIIANSCHWMLEFHASRRVRIQHCHRITRSSIIQAHFGQNIRFLYRFVHAGVPPPRPALSSPPHSPEHAHRRSCRFGLTHGCAYTYNKPRHRPDARRRCRFDAGTM